MFTSLQAYHGSKHEIIMDSFFIVIYSKLNMVLKVVMILLLLRDLRIGERKISLMNMLEIRVAFTIGV